MQSVQNIFFTARLTLFTGQRIPVGGIHRLQRDDVLIAQACDGAGEHSLDPVALADFTPDFTGDALIRRAPHELQGLLRFSFRKNIQVRGLFQVNREGFLQSSVKYRISGGIHQIAEQDGVLLRHGSAPARGEEHRQSQGSHHDSGNSRVLAKRCRPTG